MRRSTSSTATWTCTWIPVRRRFTYRSTIVDCTGEHAILRRAGEIPADRLEQITGTLEVPPRQSIGWSIGGSHRLP